MNIWRTQLIKLRQLLKLCFNKYCSVVRFFRSRVFVQWNPDHITKCQGTGQFTSLYLVITVVALDGVYHPFWAAFPNNPQMAVIIRSGQLVLVSSRSLSIRSLRYIPTSRILYLPFKLRGLHYGLNRIFVATPEISIIWYILTPRLCLPWTNVTNQSLCP